MHERTGCSENLGALDGIIVFTRTNKHAAAFHSESLLPEATESMKEIVAHFLLVSTSHTCVSRPINKSHGLKGRTGTGIREDGTILSF